MSDSSTTASPVSRLRIAALVAPAALAIGGCLLVRPEPGSLVAPFFGPWAGLPYGHYDCDCTLGRVAPAWSWAGTAALLAAVAFAWLGRGGSKPTRVASLVVLVLAEFHWFALAWLSVLNTTS